LIAIGTPIAPRPTKPIFMVFSSPFCTRGMPGPGPAGDLDTP
jgi:hypothetical protein